ncbi:hypothetical protein [Mycobacterium sp. WUMAC-067]|uniref:hypothetical protein n=1 Tax=Mycobacterium sp. WUMAC-067 TaxID=2798585 RepID=UPI0035A8D9C1
MAVVATGVVGLAVGIPSALVHNPLFVRMTPPPWWSYVVWGLVAAASGALTATYVGRRSAVPARTGPIGLVANVGSLLAVGCPVCNKLVVAAVGASGALTMWAPVQPVIAVASLALVGWALWRRLADMRSCPTPAARMPEAVGPAARSERQ